MRPHKTVKDKRIIIFLENLELGGAERQAMLLARHLKQVEQADVQVWGIKSPGTVRDLCAADGIPWRLLPWPTGRSTLHRLFGVARCALALRQAKPDVLLPYTAWPNVICGLAWRWTGAATCIWNQRDEGIALTGRAIERRAVANTPHFVANSRAGADFLSKTYGLTETKVQVIHNGVQLVPAKRSRGEWRARLNAAPERLFVCMIANLTHFKDHPTLLRAWQQVVRKVPQAQLLLAGRFDQAHDSIQALVQELHIDNSVEFLGQVDDIAGLLGVCEVLVHSSRSEGSPNAVLEAMAAGVAVVATDIVGIRDALGPDGAAYLASPGDADSLAQKLIALLQNPIERSALTELMRQRIQTEFAPQTMCLRMVAMMKDGILGKVRES